MKPLLPLDATLRQRAIGATTRLIAEFTKSDKYCIPVAKYAQEVCTLFRIPLLPMESPVSVAVKKLQEWRAQVNFRMVVDADIEAVLPQLESLVKTIRMAIASKIVTREQRKQANKRRRPKARNTFPSPLYQTGEDPYAD
ncbi:hypothetical protein V2H45_09470 [Tumidithrix elongata RA019]|uniref:Uncharacterized protein n=1 Tax=Tumidithrix elongata BACA0141 TaxID=2716417 RepID=A0AAW9PX69_9CYAN|nr:hypothetical protein [Tumidithrix elongata RA019]